MQIFKNIKGEKINVAQHTLKNIAEFPSVEIHIGTDSQNNGKYTNYSTVIAYRYGNRGVHYIYSKHQTERINDLWSRLWKECEMSIDVGMWLKEQINWNYEIDMDYNEDDLFKSNMLISSAKGWATSLGFKVNIKPNSQIATKAADNHCH